MLLPGGDLRRGLPVGLAPAAGLAGAGRPLIVLSKGAAYAQADERVRAFVESTGIPFLPMSMAKGLLPDDHPQSAAAARSLALSRADVVMLVGARLNWLLGQGEAPEWPPQAAFIPAQGCWDATGASARSHWQS